MQVLKVIQQHGKTLEEVASALGVTKGTFSVSINGTPNVKRLFDIANFLGCSPAEFFADWDTAPENEHRVVPSTAEPKTEEHPSEEQNTDADELPFTNDTPTGKDDQQQAHEARVLRFQYGCPHCGHQVRITIE